ncbi:MAG: 30S ribosomal protein S19e [Nanoarchaeota archaeon]|nr:30S ribosomal protein S19e [Nanoarchaeota archaeon]
MVTTYDVDQQELVERAAAELKKVNAIKAPEWAEYVKTGVSRERPPIDEDWWYFRAASILKNVYRLGPIGVSKLRVKYGSKKRRGVAPAHFRIGSGNIIRKILQQLEKAGFIKQVEKGVHKGKIITPIGKSFLDKIAADIKKNPTPKKVKEIKETIVIPKVESKKPKKEEKVESRSEE